MTLTEAKQIARRPTCYMDATVRAAYDTLSAAWQAEPEGTRKSNALYTARVTCAGYLCSIRR